MTLRKRRPLNKGSFNRRHPSARAFYAPQRDRETPKPVASTYVVPKVAKRAYRGSDNPKAKRRPLTARHLTLSETTHMRGSHASRRRFARVWQPA